MQENVARHYNDRIFDYESVRLTQYAPIEFALTKRYLNKIVPNGAVVADIGVGTGHYAEFLAKKDCTLYLIDISQRLLKATHNRLEKSNLSDRVIEVFNTSVTDLNCLESQVCDVVLLLGPLYHLCSLKQRQQAIEETARILKPNGTIFAAGINRLAYFRELFASDTKQALSRQKFHQQFLEDDNGNPFSFHNQRRIFTII